MSLDTSYFTTLELGDLEKIVARIRLDESEPLHSGYFLDYVMEADARWIDVIQNDFSFTPKTKFTLILGTYSVTEQWPWDELIQRIKGYFVEEEVLVLKNGDIPV